MKLTVKDKVLIIEVDLTQDQGPSKSGKTHIVDSTHGFATLPDAPGISVAVNVVRKKS